MEPYSVFPADLDGDGDLDIVVTQHFSNFLGAQVIWLENTGPQDRFFRPHVVEENATGGVSGIALDMDGDGDLDIVAFLGFELFWYENDGGSPPNFERRLLTSFEGRGKWLDRVDLDLDGDYDFVAAGNGLQWYENIDGGTVVEHPIDAEPIDSVHAVDMDGDGDVDLVVTGASTWWYENDGDFNFTKRLIHNQGGLTVQAADFNGDGAIDVAVGGSSTWWFENDGAQSFTQRFVSALGSTNLHAVDVNDDGFVDLLAAGNGRQADSNWFRNNGSGGFSRIFLATGGDYPRGVYGADLDADGDVDVITTRSGFCHGRGCQAGEISWEESSGGVNPTFTNHIITNSLLGFTDIAAGDLDGDGDVDVVSTETGEGGFLYIHENDGSKPPTFNQKFLSTQTNGQPLYIVDLNGDSQNDILTSDGITIRWFQNFGNLNFVSRILGNPLGFAFDLELETTDLNGDSFVDVVSGGAGLAWHRSNGAPTPTFTRFTLDSIRADSIAAVDLDDDSNTDIVALNTRLDQVTWFQGDGLGGFDRQVLYSPFVNGPRGAHSGDLDGDGDIDLVSVSELDGKIVWYESDGAASPSFTSHVISSGDFTGLRSAFVGDINGNGRLDIVVASREDDRVSWFENDGGSPPNFVLRDVSNQMDAPVSVFVADIDGNGRNDILTASENDDRVTAFLNLGGTPTAFFPHTITDNADRANSVFAFDVDGDGDLDVLSTSEIDDTVAWYENLGGAPPAFTKHVVTTNANGARSVSAADLDGDGDVDILSASIFDNRINWYENVGGSPPVFVEHVLSELPRRPVCVHARDIDGDGDVDIFAASEFDHQIFWYENDGGSPPNFTQRIITSDAEEAQWVFTEDIDKDGAVDVVALSFGDDRLAWHKNLGNGTFAGQDVIVNPLNNPVKMVAAHMDDDDHMDLVIVSSRKLYLLKNSGTVPPLFDVFVVADAAALSPGGGSFCFQWPYCRLKVADVTRDGYPDIVVPGYVDTPGIYWFENSGGEFPTFTPRLLDGRRMLANALDIADLDGDDDLEILWGSEENPDRIVWHENFYGMLPTPSNTPTPTNTPTPSNTFTPSETPTPTVTPSETSTLFVTATFTPTSTPTSTDTSTPTFTPTEIEYSPADVNLDRWVNWIDLFMIALDWHRWTAPDEFSDYLTDIETLEHFETVTVESTRRIDALREGKYWAPATNDPDLLPTLFQNVNLYPFHPEFLQTVFPDLFAGQDIFSLILRETPRQYFAGAIFSFRAADGGVVYGFDSVADYVDVNQLLTQEEAAEFHSILSEHFQLRPFAYSPIHPLALNAASQWTDAPFPIYLPGATVETVYEPYTLGTNYGRVRLLTVEQLAQANLDGSISWQDILVLDLAPFDIEGVQAGVVTGSRQGELSHVALRTARRGTPNAYIKDPHAAFAPYDGQLVRFTVGESGYEIETDVDLEEAQAWWDANRPLLIPVAPDLEYAGFDDVLDMNVQDSDGLVAKFGGKTAGLARMYSFLPSEHQVPAFGIPFRYYREFMETNTLTLRQGDGFVTLSFQEYLESLLDDPFFQTDPVFRSSRLQGLRNIIETRGVLDPDLVAALANRIDEVYGTTDIMVRFRSSSNSEDSVVFNGAGLYDSTSVCAEDTLDGDESGPSHCLGGPANNERTIERGLKRVWASLWNFRAFEEREYYQIPQHDSAMGILVSLAFPDEASNGVAFTGDPVAGAKAGYLINVQIGDNSTVQPDPGILPELNILKMEQGEVVGVQRARFSTLMPQGEFVLTEDQLRRLGAAMAIVDASMPLDLDGHSRDQVLLDIEFKFTHTDDLIFKQVRPFLISNFNIVPDVPIVSNERSDVDVSGKVDARDIILFLRDRGMEIVEEETDFK